MWLCRRPHAALQSPVLCWGKEEEEEAAPCAAGRNEFGEVGFCCLLEVGLVLLLAELSQGCGCPAAERHAVGSTEREQQG